MPRLTCAVTFGNERAGMIHSDCHDMKVYITTPRIPAHAVLLFYRWLLPYVRGCTFAQVQCVAVECVIVQCVSV